MSGIMLSFAGNTFGPTVLTIGEAFGGGFYAGQIGVSSVPTHYLVVAPLSSGETTNQWKNANTDTPDSVSDIDGPQNTADMVADGSSTVYPCAHFCNDLSVGAQTDWYMPARNELEVCYFNLKPTTTSNNTSSGINPNAVPARASNYTSGTPAQTTAAAFVTSTGAEAFTAAFYWSSTEQSTGRAFPQNFSTGYVNDYGKVTSLRVRAIRRVAV